MNAKPAATQKQIDFASTLIAEARALAEGHEDREQALDPMRAMWSLALGNREAMSVYIDRLISLKRDWPAQDRVAARQAPATPAATLGDGVYQAGDRLFKVVTSPRTGHSYAKEFNTGSLEWDYAGAAPIRSGLITEAHRLTAEQASAFGALYGVCVFCSHVLTDERSIDVGYGPVCADKNGLPWGVTAAA